MGHPLIHLGFAYEMDSKDLAMEALSLACIQHNVLHRYIQDPAYTKPSPLATTSLQDLIGKLSQDDRLSSAASFSYNQLEALFEKHEDVILDYWNAWDIQNATKQFEQSQEAAVAMLVATAKPGSYNFFLAHVLTTNHAVRTLLPHVPDKFHITLLRQWWLLALVVYILTGRPALDQANVTSQVDGREWTFVADKALNSQWRNDSHYVKGMTSNYQSHLMIANAMAAIRVMKEAASTWGDADAHYLRAALTFVDSFNGWSF